VDARYQAGNPWSLVRRRVGDDREAPAQIGETSRAFTPAVWVSLFAQVDLEATAGRATAPRLRWLLTFAEATGLRANELLNVRRSDFVRRDGCLTCDTRHA
jgi:integrase